MEQKEIYKAKQEWLERVMASSLTPATKVFAWGIFQHMYGEKIVSHPGGKGLKEKTGLAKSKYSVYRTALFEAGALTGVLVKGEHGDWDNYEYTLCLAWDGGVSQKDTQVLPTGVHGVSQKDVRVYPTGSTNTSSKDIELKTSNKDIESVPTKVSTPPLTTTKEGFREINTSDSGSLTLLTEAVDSIFDDSKSDGTVPGELEDIETFNEHDKNRYWTYRKRGYSHGESLKLTVDGSTYIW